MSGVSGGENPRPIGFSMGRNNRRGRSYRKMYLISLSRGGTRKIFRGTLTPSIPSKTHPVVHKLSSQVLMYSMQHLPIWEHLCNIFFSMDT